MKYGKVLLVGRPNVGKSTFLNTLVGKKIAITSPKPQTTRFPIKALFQDDRGHIVFIDTPGIFAKAKDTLSKKINQKTLSALKEEVDIVLYMVDHTRRRDFEEGKVLGLVRQIERPTILVINKVDLTDSSYLAQYRFMESEFLCSFPISALKNMHIKPLLNKIFELLPEATNEQMVHETEEKQVLNIDSKTFVSELIREKVFLMMGEEIPYTTTAIVDEITHRDNGMVYIKASILTTNERYRRMLIGKEGRKIKEIGSYARKEISLVTGKKVYLDLTVQINAHWQDLLN